MGMQKVEKDILETLKDKVTNKVLTQTSYFLDSKC